MQKILVVDDERDFRQQLGLSLSAEGFEVITTGSGRRAITIGCRFRPALLVVDWMLKDHIHGLHVSQALSAVDPSLRTVLVTAYASGHLRQEAMRSHVFDFIEKPFDLDRIQRSVRKALALPPTTPADPQVAVLELDEAGRICFANGEARRMLAATTAGPGAGHLGEAVDGSPERMLADAETGWVSLRPRSLAPETWRLRTRKLHGSGWLAVLGNELEHDTRLHEQIRLLVGVDAAGQRPWPLEGRVLVVDHDEFSRRIVASQLERAGCSAHAAESAEVALRLLARDPEIAFVIVAEGIPGVGTPELVRAIRARQPSAQIVGMSHRDVSASFAEIGVEHFLARPWTLQGFVELFAKESS